MKGKASALTNAFTSVSTRLICGMLLLILPINAMLLYFFTNDRKAIKEEAVSSVRYICNLYLNQIENETAAIDSFCLRLSLRLIKASDLAPLITDKRTSQYYYAKYALAAEFRQETYNHPLPMGYLAYSSATDDSIIVYSGDDLTKEWIMEWVKNAGNQSQARTWTLLNASGKTMLVHLYNTGNLHFGGVLELDTLFGGLDEYLDYDNNHIEFFFGDGSQRAAWGAKASNFTEVAVDLGNSSFGIAVALDEKEVYGDLPLARNVMFFMLLASLAALPLLYLWLHRLLLTPLRQIATALNRIEGGDRAYRIGERRCASEFRYINRSFDRMADQIALLKDENLEKELETNKMRIVNLQLQVRPHFLLNAFNLIYSMAQISNFGGIQKLTLYLSQYFRYLFTGMDELKSVGKELELVEAYLDINKLRYEDCFGVTIDVPDDVKSALIPPLVIHNFAENIMKYAVDRDHFVNIRICGYADGGNVCIEIADDGPGIGDDVMDAIRRSEIIQRDDGAHIGIWNCLYRVKAFCKAGADILVDSTVGAGTRVTIILPI